MEKNMKTIISVLLVGGLAGVSLFNTEELAVSAHGNRNQSNDARFENHDEEMFNHMKGMHRNFLGEEDVEDEAETNDQNEENQDDALDEDSWGDWHNQMWESRQDYFDNLEEDDEDDAEDSESFYEDMREHMWGLRDTSFNRMNGWMTDMHDSFNFRRGMMDWNEDDSDNPFNRNSRYMERFNFFNSN